MDIQKALKDGLSKEEILAAVEAEIAAAQYDEKELDEARKVYAEAQVRYYKALGRETDFDTVMKAVTMTEKYIKEPEKAFDRNNLLNDLFDIIKE